MRTAGILCGILVLVLTVHARQENKPQASKEAAAKTAPKAQKAQKSTTKKAAATEKQNTNTQSGVVVAVDPITGQLRPPTPEEMRALGQRSPQPPSQPQLIQGRGGAVGVRLGKEFQTYTIVTTTPDGQVRMDEVTGEKAAQERVNPEQTPKPSNEK